MTASAVKVGLRRKERANRPSESEKILLGHYVRFSLGSQDSRIYLGAKRLWRGKRINRNFGIKSLLSQNWGACVYTKIWREECGNSKFLRLCQSTNRLHKDRYQLIQI